MRRPTPTDRFRGLGSPHRPTRSGWSEWSPRDQVRDFLDGPRVGTALGAAAFAGRSCPAVTRHPGDTARGVPLLILGVLT
jgi:hypothetical protein